MIELMIVIAIIGILSSVAVPQYFSYLLETRRGDAQVALLLEMQSMERCRAAEMTYVGCEVRYSVSPESYYNITVSTSTTGYTLKATGQNQQSEDNDPECFEMTITSTNIRTPSPSSSKCWPN